jgi:hypothetical protein
VGIWILAIAVLYLLAKAIRQKPVNAQAVLDATSFAGSIIVLLAVVDKDTLQALGDSTVFLITAGLIGAVYGIPALI